MKTWCPLWCAIADSLFYCLVRRRKQKMKSRHFSCAIWLLLNCPAHLQTRYISPHSNKTIYSYQIWANLYLCSILIVVQCYLISRYQSSSLIIPLDKSDGSVVLVAVRINRNWPWLSIHTPNRNHTCVIRCIINQKQLQTAPRFVSIRHLPSAQPIATILSVGCQAITVASCSWIISDPGKISP